MKWKDWALLDRPYVWKSEWWSEHTSCGSTKGSFSKCVFIEVQEPLNNANAKYSVLVLMWWSPFGIGLVQSWLFISSGETHTSLQAIVTFERHVPFKKKQKKERREWACKACQKHNRMDIESSFSSAAGIFPSTDGDCMLFCYNATCCKCYKTISEKAIFSVLNG